MSASLAQAHSPVSLELPFRADGPIPYSGAHPFEGCNLPSADESCPRDKLVVKGFTVWVSPDFEDGYEKDLIKFIWTLESAINEIAQGRPAYQLLVRGLRSVDIPPEIYLSPSDFDGTSRKGLTCDGQGIWAGPCYAKLAGFRAMVMLPVRQDYTAAGRSFEDRRVIIHELAHAYHDKVVKPPALSTSGFSNSCVIEAYKQAMNDKVVRPHRCLNGGESCPDAALVNDSGRWRNENHNRNEDAYGAQNHHEYFADLVSARFQAYPFVVTEGTLSESAYWTNWLVGVGSEASLGEYDNGGLQMLRSLFPEPSSSAPGHWTRESIRRRMSSQGFDCNQ